MSQTISLKELERKAWRSTFQDGIWDIYLGLLLVAMGALSFMTNRGMPETMSMLIYIGLIIVTLIILWAGKKFITVPRMGRVKFGEKRKARLNWVRLFLVLSVVLGIVAWVATPILISGGISRITLTTFVPALWALNCIILFSMGAYFLDFSRLYLIGILYAIAIPANEVLIEFTNLNLSYLTLGLPGLIIVAMGLVVLVRFLHEYPTLNVPGEVPDGSQH